MRIEQAPVGEGDELDAACLKQAQHIGGLPRRQRRGRLGQIRNQTADGIHRALLVAADHPAGTALDPAGGIFLVGCSLVDEYPTVVIGNYPAAFVEGHASNSYALIAGGVDHQAGAEVQLLVGGNGADRAATVRLQVVAHRFHSRDAMVLADELGRRGLEYEADALTALLRSGLGFLQQGQVMPGFGVQRFGQLRGAGGVQQQIVGLHQDIHALGVEQLAQLLGGKSGLHRPAPGDQADFADIALAQGLQGVVGDVGAFQFGHRHGEDARDIQRHVAHADHHRGVA